MVHSPGCFSAEIHHHLPSPEAQVLRNTLTNPHCEVFACSPIVHHSGGLKKPIKCAAPGPVEPRRWRDFFSPSLGEAVARFPGGRPDSPPSGPLEVGPAWRPVPDGSIIVRGAAELCLLIPVPTDSCALLLQGEPGPAVAFYKLTLENLSAGLPEPLRGEQVLHCKSIHL